MSLRDEIAAVRALFQRYDNVPASLADACLIRLAELHELPGFCRWTAISISTGVTGAGRLD